MNMAFLFHKIHSPIFHSFAKPTRFFPQSCQLLHNISEPPQKQETIITDVCNSLSKGLSWDILSQKFSSVYFSPPIVQKILLQLKEPLNAKKALRFFHWSEKHMHFPHRISSYCITIHISVKAKLVNDAKALLESILKDPCNDKGANLVHDSQLFSVLDSLLDTYEIADSTPFVFDLLMQTCAKLRMIDDVVDACEILDENGFGLSIISYNTLLHVIQKSEKTYMVWRVYEHMIKKRMYPNEVTFRIMVSALCKEGRLNRFLDVVERIHGKRCSLPGIVVNTCLVFGMIEEGRIGDGLVLLKRMSQKNMILDTVSFSLVVFAKVNMGDLDAAWEVYEKMCERGFEGNAFVSTLFIGAYCEKGRIEEAIRLLQEMDNLEVKPFDETFNHLIESCSRAGYLEESLKFCKRMIKMGMFPSLLAFNKMLEMLSANGDAKQADEIFTVMLDKGFIPNESTYSLLVTGYGKVGDVEGILKLFYEMEYRSLSPSSSVFCTLIVSLCQHGRVREADEFLLLMKANSLVLQSYAYEALIASHLEKGEKTRAHELYEEMDRYGLKTAV